MSILAYLRLIIFLILTPAVFLGMVVSFAIIYYRMRPLWRVRYPCGGVSYPMPYKQARDYAEIFDGKVERL